jgi:hypothetical protein
MIASRRRKIMRFSSPLTAAAAALVALATASCASHESFPTQPVAAQLTDVQANVLAQQYLDQHSVAAPRTCQAQQRQPDGWWLTYQPPFNPAARPPLLSYVIQVHKDGTVTQRK